VKRTITAVITVCLLITGILTLGYLYAVEAVHPVYRDIPSSAELPFDSRYNLLQTFNNCGPYNCAIVVHVLTGRKVNVKDFVRKMEWRLPNKTTLPWGLEKILNEYGVKTEVPFLVFFSPEHRLDYLRAQLAHGKPVILLGLKKGIGHYLTLLGYSGSFFYVYDSWHAKNPLRTGHYTYDDNGSLPGNMTLSADQILDFWKGSEKFLFFAWYALVAGPAS